MSPAWSLAGALVTLRHEVDDAFPGRSKVSDGTLGDTAHAARKSDHNPDERGVVRAWDCTRDVVDGIDVAEYLAEWLRRVKDPRVKYLIFRRRICSSYPVGDVAAWTWRPYDGLNAHEHHLHISVQPRPAGDDDRPWGFKIETPEDDVAAADVWNEPLPRAETDDPNDKLAAKHLLGLAVRYGLHAAQRADAVERELAQVRDQLVTLTAVVQSLVPAPPVDPPPAA